MCFKPRWQWHLWRDLVNLIQELKLTKILRSCDVMLIVILNAKLKLKTCFRTLLSMLPFSESATHDFPTLKLLNKPPLSFSQVCYQWLLHVLLLCMWSINLTKAKCLPNFQSSTASGKYIWLFYFGKFVLGHNCNVISLTLRFSGLPGSCQLCYSVLCSADSS